MVTVQSFIKFWIGTVTVDKSIQGFFFLLLNLALLICLKSQNDNVKIKFLQLFKKEK